MAPEKLVRSPADMPRWLASEGYADYTGFIKSVADAIGGCDVNFCDAAKPANPAVSALHDVLDTLSDWVDAIPPVDQPQRFGNASFRTWHAKLVDECHSLLAKVVKDEESESAIDELSIYLCDAFGNSTRIDYGTGHEMAFVTLLLALAKIGVITADDRRDVGLSVFARYMRLCRHLQLSYRMEPAGSQGVWSLDDHQFVPFIWGAAQMISHEHSGGGVTVTPAAISDTAAVADWADRNHLFAAVRHVLSVKTGPFAEHSNQLWNISAVASWSKVHRGLMKMYENEVLAKFPVVQHVYFGRYLSLHPQKKTVVMKI